MRGRILLAAFLCASLARAGQFRSSRGSTTGSSNIGGAAADLTGVPRLATDLNPAAAAGELRLDGLVQPEASPILQGETVHPVAVSGETAREQTPLQEAGGQEGVRREPPAAPGDENTALRDPRLAREAKVLSGSSDADPGALKDAPASGQAGRLAGGKAEANAPALYENARPAADVALTGHEGAAILSGLLPAAADPTVAALNRERGVAGVLGWLKPWRWASRAEALRLRPSEVSLRLISQSSMRSDGFQEWARGPEGRGFAFARDVAERLEAIDRELGARGLERLPLGEGGLGLLPVEVLTDLEIPDESARKSLRHVGAFHMGGKIYVYAGILHLADARETAAVILHEWLAMRTGLPHKEVASLLDGITGQAFGSWSRGMSPEGSDAEPPLVFWTHPIADWRLQELADRSARGPQERDTSPVQPAPAGDSFRDKLRDPAWVAEAGFWALAAAAPTAALISLWTGLWPAFGAAAVAASGVALIGAGWWIAQALVAHRSRRDSALEELLVAFGGLGLGVLVMGAGIGVAFYGLFVFFFG
ncbi:MAG TPA: hypothetical protein VNI01_10525 [Elusimicrobiota bacterium]|nr:hypothetical protein [Elusimicrobiota bacterium]